MKEKNFSLVAPHAGRQAYQRPVTTLVCTEAIAQDLGAHSTTADEKDAVAKENPGWDNVWDDPWNNNTSLWEDEDEEKNGQQQ